MFDVDYKEFEALNPFFAVIFEAIGKEVDGDKFFDILADDVVWEYGFPFAGTPRTVEGRDNLIAHFSGYGNILWLDSTSGLRVHRTSDMIVLEYASHGRGVQTGKPYNNHYVSFIAIKDRKVTHWRDYSNKLAVLEAVGGADAVSSAMPAPAAS